MEKAIIFDIDGTILMPSAPPHQDHIVEPNKKLIELLMSLWRNRTCPKVLLVTGRHERLRKMTQDELLANGIFYDELIMNDMLDWKGDIAKGAAFKLFVAEKILERYDVLCAIDDDYESVESYRARGIQVLHLKK